MWEEAEGYVDDYVECAGVCPDYKLLLLLEGKVMPRPGHVLSHREYRANDYSYHFKCEQKIGLHQLFFFPVFYMLLLRCCSSYLSGNLCVKCKGF